MKEEMRIIFFLVFFFVAVIYAFIASFTSVLYRNKNIGELSCTEANILYGRASVTERLIVFVVSIFVSVSFPPCYIVAGLATWLYWVFA